MERFSVFIFSVPSGISGGRGGKGRNTLFQGIFPSAPFFLRALLFQDWGSGRFRDIFSLRVWKITYSAGIKAIPTSVAKSIP